MKVVGVGEAPGHRDIPIKLAFGPDAIEVDTSLNKDEAIGLMKHLQEVNAFAWRGGEKPIDAKDGESRPLWVKEQSLT